MAKDDLGAKSADDLRTRALRRLAVTGVDLEGMPLEDIQALVHELQVHQIELEMQNEELRLAQEEIQEARAKYADLYECAPVGYFTLDRRGLVLEANLTGVRLLGMEKQQLIGSPFFLLVAPEDRQLLHAHLQKIFSSRDNQSCELKLAPREGVPNHLALESIAVDDQEGDMVRCRTAVIDITENKQAKQHVARLASFPQLSPSPIIEINHTGAITFHNEAAIKTVRELGLDDLRSLLPGDLDETLAAIRQKGEKGFCLEIEKQDVIFFVHAHYTPECQAIRFYYTDVTKRKRAERALRESESRLRAIFEQAAVGVAQVETATGRFIEVNQKFCDIVGLSPEEMTATNFMAITLPEDREVDLQYLQKLLNGQIRTFSREKRYLVRNGSIVWVNLTVSPMWNLGEAPNYHIAVVEDITERKRAEEALRGSAAMLNSIFKAAPIGIGLVKNRRFAWTNEQVTSITGYTAEELRGQSARLLYESEEEFARVGQVKYEQIGKQGTGTVETRFQCKDHSVKDILLSSTPLDPAHPTGAVIFTALDITERRRTREDLYREKEKYRVLTEELPLGVAIIDRSGRYRYLSPKFTEIFGYTLADIPTGKEWFAKAFPNAQYRREVRSVWMNELREAKIGESRPRTYSVICKDGREKIIHFRPVTLGTKDQLIIYEDISERSRAEETLKSLIATAPIGIYIIQKGKFVLINPGFEAITGYRSSELLGQDSLTLVTPEYQALVKKQALRALKKGDSSPYEYQFTSKSGETGWVMETIIPTRYEGKRAVLGYFMDITSRKKLEKQFLQAQRMEAVGRLAGGLAHDFSNVLAVIIIYVETMLKEVREGDPLGLHIKGVKEAAHRAISLTRQLMALGRRQLLQPRAIKVNDLVSGMAEMLRRLLDEDVELVLTLGPGEIVAKVDPSQLEQVLLNLVVNARDAMPQGGRLTIATDEIFLGKSSVSQHVDVAPGRYVMLAVSDTGIGMDQETQAHILEPFYTTKPSGEGSGLGLSTVYGIVKQSGGFIEVWSEPGNGATFKIFLPVIQETPESPAPIPESRLLQGSETILLVEDVDDLRKLVQDVLKDYGYTVLTASHGSEALEIGERHQGPIHLLLLDVVLPQMSGAEIAERLKSSYPGTRVLYMSGYPEDAIIHRKLLDGTAAFIQKPFAPTALLAKVRELLDSAKQEVKGKIRDFEN